MSLESASELFSKTFLWTSKRQGALDLFREVSSIGLEHATEHIASNSFNMTLWAIQMGIIKDKEKFDAGGGVEGFATIYADTQINGQKLAVDAASLVFAHTILDKAILDYCRVTALVDANLWKFAINKKKISISELESLGVDEIIRSKLDDYFEKLDRESLLKKSDLLHQVCSPINSRNLVEGYVFDRDKLESLDKIRHDIVHGKDVTAPLPNNDDDIEYLKKTLRYFVLLINGQFDLKFDPDILTHKPK